MIGHTPGPWTCDVDETEFFGEYRIHPAFDLDYHGGQDDANARLIAAAPDLLAACRSAASLLWGLRVGPDNPVLVALDAAIAKATTGEGAS